MAAINTWQKVLITNISPQVNEGAYPAKGVINRELIISADIFTDGHEEIKACIVIKHTSDRKWTEVPMTFVHNDHWEFYFEPERRGMYSFRIKAWTDPFTSWQKSLLKKKQ